MRVKDFLKKKNITVSPKTYFVTAMSAMAQGLFATLLMGTILKTLGEWFDFSFFTEIASVAMNGCVVGAAIGVSVAYALKATPLVLFSCAGVGAAGYIGGTSIVLSAEKVIEYAAGPAGAFLAVIVACEIGKIVSGETKIDLIVTPFVTLISGFAVSLLICPAVAYLMYWLGDFVNTATTYQPLLMGIVISVVVGIILTLPISSAAICAMIGISGIAGGAAFAGCAAQMVGFAVISFRENRWGGIVAQGIGTSMLQMGNIVKKPVIWLPPIIASAVTGALSTTVFKLECEGVAAGMGTCGLVGPLGVITAAKSHDAMLYVGLVLIGLVLPAVISLAVSELLRRLGIIKAGDMKLDL